MSLVQRSILKLSFFDESQTERNVAFVSLFSIPASVADQKIYSGTLLSSNSTAISILDFLFFIFFEAYILNYYKYLLDFYLAYFLMMCHYFSCKT